MPASVRAVECTHGCLPLRCPQVLNLTQDTVREMLASTNQHEMVPGVPPSQLAFAQGIVVKPNSSYSLYGVSALYYSGLWVAGVRTQLGNWWCPLACAQRLLQLVPPPCIHNPVRHG